MVFHWGVGAAHQHLTVALDPDDVGVGIADLHHRGVLPRGGLDDDLQVGDPLQQLSLADAGVQQLSGPLQVGRGDGGQHLQPPLGVAPHRAQHGAGVDPLEAAGVGDHHPLDVFDDVAAAGDHHLLGLLPQHLAGLGGGQGDGNGLGAAQGGYQFPL